MFTPSAGRQVPALTQHAPQGDIGPAVLPRIEDMGRAAIGVTQSPRPLHLKKEGVDGVDPRQFVASPPERPASVDGGTVVIGDGTPPFDAVGDAHSLVAGIEEAKVEALHVIGHTVERLAQGPGRFTCGIQHRFVIAGEGGRRVEAQPPEVTGQQARFRVETGQHFQQDALPAQQVAPCEAQPAPVEGHAIRVLPLKVGDALPYGRCHVAP